MKKIVYLILVICVLGSVNAFAQMKTKFTQQSSISDSPKLTGAVEEKGEKIKNTVDVKVPKITRGIERYPKLNIFGEIISDEFLFYRGVLNERQQVVYDQIYNTMMEGENIVNPMASITETELDDVIDAVYFDNPELFWWSGAYTWWSNSDDIVTKIRMNCWIELSDIQDYYNKFWAMTIPVIYYASYLPNDMAKIKYIHDYICLSTDYDQESFDSGNYGGKLQTAYSCVVDYNSVCTGYSSAFQYYMQQLGIPCTSISGSGHRWNMLKVNSQYYQMDVTWDDTQLVPKYYNLPHSEMQKFDSHTPKDFSAKVINKYPSSGTDMTYVNYHGLLLEGSPYTYQELESYDYSLEKQKSNYIYKDKEKRIELVNNMDEFYNQVSEQVDFSDDYTLKITVATTNTSLDEEIDDALCSDSDVARLIYKRRSFANSFHYHTEAYQILDYTLYEITITLK